MGDGFCVGLFMPGGIQNAWFDSGIAVSSSEVEYSIFSQPFLDIVLGE